jgi:hypothetical protein
MWRGQEMSKNVFAVDKKTHQQRTFAVRLRTVLRSVFLASMGRKLLVSPALGTPQNNAQDLV